VGAWPAQETNMAVAGNGSAALSCKAEAGKAHGGVWWQRERGNRGACGLARGKEKWARPKGIVKFFIYSKRFQMSMNCFDQKVNLPSSKNFK
jgi:hypothetical protein